MLMLNLRENFGFGRCGVIAFGIALAISMTWGADIDSTKIPPAPNRKVDFEKDVKPIFAAQCYKCHGPEKQKSDYRLDIKMSALKGGSIGGAIVPGDSAKSLLVQYVAGA